MCDNVLLLNNLNDLYIAASADYMVTVMLFHAYMWRELFFFMFDVISVLCVRIYNI